VGYSDPVIFPISIKLAVSGRAWETACTDQDQAWQGRAEEQAISAALRAKFPTKISCN